jgi:hypothetical protein
MKFYFSSVTFVPKTGPGTAPNCPRFSEIQGRTEREENVLLDVYRRLYCGKFVHMCTNELVDVQWLK